LGSDRTTRRGGDAGRDGHEHEAHYVHGILLRPLRLVRLVGAQRDVAGGESLAVEGAAVAKVAAVRERPILFSAPMVRAILDGRKTMTRRIVKPQHVDGIETYEERFSFMHAPDCGGYCDYACAAAGEVLDGHIGWTPWGSNPADRPRLWVREAWQPGPEDSVWYKATDDAPGGCYARLWRPSIHMPRWASRITLEITAVRVERLQEIDEGDAFREGVERQNLTSDTLKDVPPPFNKVHPLTGSYRDAFAALWDQINGKGSWLANPWVWVVSFKRV
jgi:hypothetical protein